MSHSHRLLLAALIVPALSAVAVAQPGACDDCYAPAPVVVTAPGPELGMANRLGVGLHVASLAIANREDPEAEPTHLGGGGLQVRYRLNRRWELELGFTALRETDEDGEVLDGPEIHAATVGALFHMRPGRRWDWYLLGAIGGIHVGDRRDDDHDKGRAMAQLGIGIERRWNHLSIAAELRAVGIAPEHDESAGREVDVAGRGAAPPPPPPPPPVRNDDRGDAGAQFQVSATYYF
jgi:hypothetical protein